MMTHIYYPETLKTNTRIILPDQAHQHLSRVMRKKSGELFTLFNGDGYQYQAIFEPINRQRSAAVIQTISEQQLKPPLALSLACGIIKKERMSYLIEKATELGVERIYPLITERSNIKLKASVLEKNKAYWQKIAITACEQSGRCYLPIIESPILLDDWLKAHQSETIILLSQFSEKKLPKAVFENNKINLLSGTEGGFSEQEMLKIKETTPLSMKISDHILRAETAPIAGMAICDYMKNNL